jgi:hypothetical protein
MPIRAALIAAATCALLGACTWVKMEPGGQAIRVAREGDDLGYCQRLGEIAVSVKDQVGLYRRDPIKVRDELEVMARNEAPGMQADTLQAIDEPVNGEQRFTAFRCRGGSAATTAPANPASRADGPRGDDEAEVFPVRED